MKLNNKKGKRIALSVASLFLLTSCTAGFEEINRPKQKADAETLSRDNYNISSFLVQLQNNSFPEQENASQMTYDLIGRSLGRYVTHTTPGWNGKTFTNFGAPNNWVNWPFRDILPKVIGNMDDIKRLAGENYTSSLSYNWALILRAHSFLHLTDMYGPLPLGLEANAPNAYNSQELIYKQLIADLDQAVGYLKSNNVGVVSSLKGSDNIYSGDFAKWRKLANSLKLRIAIRIKLVAPDLAKSVAESAVADGVIADNTDNLVRYYNPLGIYKTSVEWGDSRATADIDVYLNGYQDPRATAYFKPTVTPGARQVIGMLAGANSGNKVIATNLYSMQNFEATSGNPYLTAAEMFFCRAEGVLAGWNMGGGSAKDYYEEGIKASFKQWHVSGEGAYIANNYSTPASYEDANGGYGGGLSSPSTITIAWDETSTPAIKLERIITQKWIALYPNGQEAWSELRRTGYPKVFPIQTTKNGYTIEVPNRIPFDNDEKVNNPANYAKGVLLLNGADDYATKMWWQK